MEVRLCEEHKRFQSRFTYSNLVASLLESVVHQTVTVRRVENVVVEVSCHRSLVIYTLLTKNFASILGFPSNVSGHVVPRLRLDDHVL